MSVFVGRRIMCLVYTTLPEGWESGYYVEILRIDGELVSIFKF